ncbi:Aste57867_1173 [Aphanomyces stellatus]|uniref:Aste57867_1173 protein n=1 Tax=Aphanomyces stellatus TaxID=120398 RepID=A0A485K783_9STRA|nr:hypothetical protein As57867_001172 [Aphanomyces stellatus]VFT78393.1 Aste57867_1173 [Aphanomyces stellatus]
MGARNGADNKMASATESTKARRQRLHIERQRQLRSKQRSAYTTLLREVAGLEVALATLVAEPRGGGGPAILRWQDVARALQDARDDSVGENRMLQRRVHATETLLQQLHAWVSRRVPMSLDATGRTWRDTTLLGSPEARQMGKAWITSRMHMQAARVFYTHGFPTTLNDPFFDTTVEHRTIQSRCQLTIPLPMDVLVGMYRHHLCEITCLDLSLADIEARQFPVQTSVVEITETTALHQVIRRHRSQGHRLDEVIHMLVGVSRTNDDRAVVVATTILEDAVALIGDRAAMIQRPFHAWYEFHRVSEWSTHMRSVIVFGIAQRHHKPLAWAEEAHVWDAAMSSSDAAASAAGDATTTESVLDARRNQQIQRGVTRIADTAYMRGESIVAKFLQGQAGIAC